MKLNVGCGTDTWGDIRLDITKNMPTWSREKSSANIIADAHHLPFKTKSFEELKAHNVLEHLHDWKKALNEFARVSQRVDIKVPIISSQPRATLTNFVLTLFSIKRIKNLLSTATIRALANLPTRAKSHIWQFNTEALTLVLKPKFTSIQVYTPTISVTDFQSSLKFKHSIRIIASSNTAFDVQTLTQAD